MRVVVTGGGGYVGSHLLVTLLARGDEVLVVDSFVRGRPEAVSQAAALAGRSPAVWAGDLLDRDGLRGALAAFGPDAVVHCAGFKSVEESVRAPDRYVRNNAEATAALADVIRALGIRRVVYASTGAVYGDADAPHAIPVGAPLRPRSPYAATKADGEAHLAALPAEVAVATVRFFNVCGAHPSGTLGDPTPANLVPALLLRARAARPEVTLFGTDWPTADGTCVRDYVHVDDVAAGLAAALDATARAGARPTCNLGTGTGVSVARVVDEVERVTGATFVRRAGPRRPGDPAICVADATSAAALLGWRPRHGFAAMVATAWRWALTAAPPAPRDSGPATG